jgi:hypothetical protein
VAPNCTYDADGRRARPALRRPSKTVDDHSHHHHLPVILLNIDITSHFSENKKKLFEKLGQGAVEKPQNAKKMGKWASKA